MVRKRLTVKRKGYTRKAHKRKSYKKDVKRGRGVKMKRIPATTVKATRVPPTTFKIKDVGAVGRGKKVVKIRRRGYLKNLGYSIGASVSTRREALRKAIRNLNAPTVFRMLQAQVVLRKRTQPRARKVFVADRNWVEKKMTKAEKLGMTAKPRKKWMTMTPRQRALAMPERKGRDRRRLREVV